MSKCNGCFHLHIKLMGIIMDVAIWFAECGKYQDNIDSNFIECLDDENGDVSRPEWCKEKADGGMVGV